MLRGSSSSSRQRGEIGVGRHRWILRDKGNVVGLIVRRCIILILGIVRRFVTTVRVFSILAGSPLSSSSLLLAASLFVLQTLQIKIPRIFRGNVRAIVGDPILGIVVRRRRCRCYCCSRVDTTAIRGHPIGRGNGILFVFGKGPSRAKDFAGRIGPKPRIVFAAGTVTAVPTSRGIFRAAVAVAVAILLLMFGGCCRFFLLLLLNHHDSVGAPVGIHVQQSFATIGTQGSRAVITFVIIIIIVVVTTIGAGTSTTIIFAGTIHIVL
mmetsp:Transcript_22402/g.48745  ORF Transcript_22402/g.48745 Transcript_22402/m.48745 type:complete len:266 (+) Transcript_22402:28-825(+)